MLVCWIDTKTFQRFDSQKALQSLNVWSVIFKAQLNLFLIIRRDVMVP